MQLYIHVLICMFFINAAEDTVHNIKVMTSIMILEILETIAMRNGYRPTLEILQILFQTTAMKQTLPESITQSFWFSSAYKSFTSYQPIKCAIIALCSPPKVHTLFIKKKKKKLLLKKMAPTDLLDTGLSQAFILSQPQYLGSAIKRSAIKHSVQVYPWRLFTAKSQAC